MFGAFHRNEIQNELHVIEREVQHYQKIFQQQRRQHTTTPVTPTTDPSPTFNGDYHVKHVLLMYIAKCVYCLRKGVLRNNLL